MTDTAPLSLSLRFADTDSQSDSDWLDIASTRDSEDDDDGSVDSDHHEISSTTRSRRSSMSTTSSKAGEIEAWEGFVSEVEDDSPASGHEGDLADTPFIDPEADQRVKLALDQSLMSTLSGSRTNSHSSSLIRDLRLSFPDPLTSSHETTVLVSGAISEADSTSDDAHPGDLTVVEELKSSEHPVAADVQPSKEDMAIYLYGTSWEGRDDFVTRFLKRTGLNSPVWDLTRNSTEPTPSAHSDSRPSLAIIFLPDESTIHAPSFQKHTLYLPVVINSQRDDAKSQCDALHIPEWKLLHLLSAEMVDWLDPDVVKDALFTMPPSAPAPSVKKFTRDPFPGIILLALACFLANLALNVYYPAASTLATVTHEVFYNATVTSAISLRPSSSISLRPDLIQYETVLSQASQQSTELAYAVPANEESAPLSTEISIRPSAALSIPTMQKSPSTEATVSPSEGTKSISVRITDSLAEFFSGDLADLSTEKVEKVTKKVTSLHGNAKENARNMRISAEKYMEESLHAIGEAIPNGLDVLATIGSSIRKAPGQARNHAREERRFVSEVFFGSS